MKKFKDVVKNRNFVFIMLLAVAGIIVLTSNIFGNHSMGNLRYLIFGCSFISACIYQIFQKDYGVAYLSGTMGLIFIMEFFAEMFLL